MAAIHPMVQWAQRKDTVLLTVDIQDAQDVKVKVGESLSLSATAAGKEYAFDHTLFAAVVSEESSHVVRPRCIEIKLQKKDAEAEFWPRLTEAKAKHPKIQIDWNRWKDEDEVDEKEDLGDFGGMGGMGGGMGGMMGGMGGGAGGGMDMAAMQQMLAGMGGGGAMGGGPDKDSDDEEEEMPPLEQ